MNLFLENDSNGKMIQNMLMDIYDDVIVVPKSSGHVTFPILASTVIIRCIFWINTVPKVCKLTQLDE